MKAYRTKIVVALGSNVNQEAHIQQAKALLETTFNDMEFGTSVWTEPIGISSDKFLNVIGVGYTNVNKERTILALKNMEHKCGRRIGERVSLPWISTCCSSGQSVCTRATGTGGTSRTCFCNWEFP